MTFHGAAAVAGVLTLNAALAGSGDAEFSVVAFGVDAAGRRGGCGLAGAPVADLVDRTFGVGRAVGARDAGVEMTDISRAAVNVALAGCAGNACALCALFVRRAFGVGDAFWRPGDALVVDAVFVGGRAAGVILAKALRRCALAVYADLGARAVRVVGAIWHGLAGVIDATLRVRAAGIAGAGRLGNAQPEFADAIGRAAGVILALGRGQRQTNSGHALHAEHAGIGSTATAWIFALVVDAFQVGQKAFAVVGADKRRQAAAAGAGPGRRTGGCVSALPGYARAHIASFGGGALMIALALFARLTEVSVADRIARAFRVDGAFAAIDALFVNAYKAIGAFEGRGAFGGEFALAAAHFAFQTGGAVAILLATCRLVGCTDIVGAGFSCRAIAVPGAGGADFAAIIQADFIGATV